LTVARSRSPEARALLEERAFPLVGRHHPADASDKGHALGVKDPTGIRCGVDATRGERRWLWFAFVALAMLSAGSCQGQARVPTIAGVVQAIEPTDTQATRFLLQSGSVTVDIAADDGLYPAGGGSPHVGDLLVVGSDDQATWYVVIAGGSSTGEAGHCYVFSVNGVDRAEAIDTSIGVRFPKTADFDRGPDTDGNYNEQPHAFCVNERGEIFAWV